MHNTNAHQLYAQNHINVESSEKLIELLYEGVLRFNLQAKKAIENKDIEKKSYWINRSTKVLAALAHNLNFEQGDVAYYLHGLYSYQIEQLSQANLHMDNTFLDSVNHVMRGLCEAWKDSVNIV